MANNLVVMDKDPVATSANPATASATTTTQLLAATAVGVKAHTCVRFVGRATALPAAAPPLAITALPNRCVLSRPLLPPPNLGGGGSRGQSNTGKKGGGGRRR